MVDEDRPDIEALIGTEGEVDVLGKNSRLEAESGLVDGVESGVEIFVGVESEDGGEGFFGAEFHRGSGAFDDRGFEAGALGDTAADQACAGVESGGDAAKDGVEGGGGDHGADDR